MAEITNPHALAVAAHLAKSAESSFGPGSVLTYVRLDPDGTLWATDGVGIIRARGAHDGDFPRSVYWKPAGFRPTNGALSYTLDVGESTLTERRARSTREHEIEVATGVDWPAVGNAIPSLIEPRPPECYFDTIRAGDLARAYGLYVGVWHHAVHAGRLLAALGGLVDGDTVVLAAVHPHETLMSVS